MEYEFLVVSPVDQCLLSRYPTRLCQVQMLYLMTGVLIAQQKCHLLNASMTELQMSPEDGPML